MRVGVDYPKIGKGYPWIMQLVLPSLFNLRRYSGSRSRRTLLVRTAASLPASRNPIIRCMDGRVWITESRGNDVILEAGDKYVGGREKIVVEALEDSVIEISPSIR